LSSDIPAYVIYALDDHHFWPVVDRKGVKQRFPDLVEKESLLVDVDVIAPMLD